MAQWLVKDLSQLTHISVQTLHHYDRIGLLKPSVRRPNGYRSYSEADLLKLQQIIALKFFGFGLSQIKTLLNAEVNMVDHFATQSKFLEEKAKSLFEASNTLKNILSHCSQDKSIPWETIIKLIEVYRMTQELEKTWAGKVLNKDELKQYAQFEQELKTKFTPEHEKTSQKKWAEVVSDVNAHLSKDPRSAVGIATGKKCMDFVNALYGKKYAGLRDAIWHKGFKSGKVDQVEPQLSLEAVEWLDKAIDAYYAERITYTLNQVGNEPHEVAIKHWEDLVTDICGEDKTLKDKLFEQIVNSDQISDEAKIWLRKNS